MDSDEGPLYKQVYKMSNESPDIVVFLDRQTYYKVFADSASFVANQVLSSSSMIKTGTQGNYMNLNINQFENAVRDTLFHHKKCVKVVKIAGNVLEVVSKGTPGNTEDFEYLFEQDSSTCQGFDLAAIHIHASQNPTGLDIALGAINTSQQKIIFTEFSDSTYLVGLEMALVQLGVKELLVNEERKELNGLCQELDIFVSATKMTSSTSSLIEKLIKLVHSNKAEKELKFEVRFPDLVDKPSIQACLNGLLTFLNLDIESLKNTFRLSQFLPSQYVQLDCAAMKALNVFPKPKESSKNVTSIYGILNNCSTKTGQRLLTSWLRQPLTCIDSLNARLDVVEFFCANIDSVKRLSAILKVIPDIGPILKKFISKKAKLEDCYRIYLAVEKISLLVSTLNELVVTSHIPTGEVVSNQLIEPLQTIEKELSNFTEMVETVLDFESIASRRFLVKPDFDPVIAQLRCDIDDAECSAQEETTRLARKLSLESLKLDRPTDSDSLLGFCCKVSKKEEKAIRDANGIRIVEATKGGGVKIETTRLASLSKDWREWMKQMENVQTKIVSEVVEVARGYLDPLNRVSDVVAKLDVLLSFAIASTNAPIPYVRPVLKSMTEDNTGDEDDVLILNNCRHPCLERMPGISYISNSVHFARNQTDKNDENTAASFFIITGPNMGGKSTFLRSIGCCVLLAQIGCFVPTESSATISVRDKILARLGASDCLTRGISTFMAEMLETGQILRLATRRSLVLIDELGRGTSTFDGFALATEITRYIASHIGSFGLFATHFHEITALSHQLPGVISNLHLEVALNSCDENEQDRLEEVTLLYKVCPGPSQNSYGLQVAHQAGFPDEVIRDAKAHLRELESFEKCKNRDEEDAEQRFHGQENIRPFAERVLQFAEELANLDEDIDDKALVSEVQNLKKRLNLEHLCMN